MTTLNFPITLAERGLLPDTLVRLGIRRLLNQRLASFTAEGAPLDAFVALMDAAPIAPLASKANDQHYEGDAEFFDAVLGPQRKYSCCYWPDGVSSLDEAEERALRLTCEHAQLTDGQHVLELGCGWGSLTLWIARQFPNTHVTAVSNSHSQRAFIQQQAQRAGLSNVSVITADVSSFELVLLPRASKCLALFRHAQPGWIGCEYRPRDRSIV
jgi:cyclopropane-fatty-acyl-phospholipid synthase